MIDASERIQGQIFFDTVGAGCWLWMGHLDRTGYGRTRFRGRRQPAHRVSWTLAVGEIPTGMVIDHLCRTRSCVNPAHLRICTQASNVHAPGSAAIAKAESARTVCPRNHALAEPNLVPSQLKRGFRECLVCNRARNRVRYARLQGVVVDLQIEADRRYSALVSAA